MKNNQWIIIGAGATGLCASIVLSRAGHKITLLEQNSKIGKKILVSGNGKCNIGNKNIEISKFHSQNMEFIKDLLNGYDYKKIKEFFTSIGLVITEGDEGKLFPISMQSSSVVKILEYEARRMGVKILCDCKVSSINKKNNIFEITSSQGDMQSTHLLISSGSISAPQLGGNDSGYTFSSKLGHTLVPRYPSLVQLCSDDKEIQACVGVKTPSLVKLYANSEYITQTTGDLLFTSYGVSGLAILDISREVSIRMANYEYCELIIDLMPTYSKEKLTNLLLNNVDKNSQKPIVIWLHGILNEKLIPLILKQSKSKVKIEKEINRKEINRLVHCIKNIKISISGSKSYKNAEVTAGGVNTSEVNPLTLESKIVKNLYFGGEILDVDGDRGGFNFHFAWSCALRIGANASLSSLS